MPQMKFQIMSNCSKKYKLFLYLYVTWINKWKVWNVVEISVDCVFLKINKNLGELTVNIPSFHTSLTLHYNF